MDSLKKVKNAPSMKLFDDEAEEQHLWEVRESGLGATAAFPARKMRGKGGRIPLYLLTSVGPYLRDLRGCSKSMGTSARSTATSARVAFTPGSTSS